MRPGQQFCWPQGFVRQPAQQEDTATDSDICSSRSSADSELSDSDIEEPSVVVATGTKADQIGSPTYPALLRRPTLVQHAAAATIQRRFRQHIAVMSKQGSEALQTTFGGNSKESALLLAWFSEPHE
ncbi:TPA: hypothetical protein ACH3X2_014000 [Trebouxia sp. C0005]